MNISSIVVQVLPKYYDEVKQSLKESGVCEYHFGEKEKGKMILTIEGEGVEEEIKKLVHIQQTPHVITADMMQTYQEELEGAIKEIEEADIIPDMLNMDSVDVRDIIYNGDLKKKDFHGGV
ncbi:Periplasmic nitrate reductase component NapD [hydrothermal vent metagenome]|uniref:Periplasmic nitrate reductase component NapD n=1 Tax=hydrothermal vent metagenome TaxID=652676 RepID=A0A1W1D0M9_9ZZZZ